MSIYKLHLCIYIYASIKVAYLHCMSACLLSVLSVLCVVPFACWLRVRVLFGAVLIDIVNCCWSSSLARLRSKRRPRVTKVEGESVILFARETLGIFFYKSFGHPFLFLTSYLGKMEPQTRLPLARHTLQTMHICVCCFCMLSHTVL
jgi:hypothetical protein